MRVFEAGTLIHGDDLYLAPGFIDSHAHFDAPVFSGDCINYCKLSQGVTTEISGNCGISLAPVTAQYLQLWRTYLERSTGCKVTDKIADFTSYDSYYHSLENLELALMPHITLDRER